MEQRKNRRLTVMAIVALSQATATISCAYLMHPNPPQHHYVRSKTRTHRVRPTPWSPISPNLIFPSATIAPTSIRPSTKRFYVDEWADASDMELTFNSSNNNNISVNDNTQKTLPLLKRMHLQFIRLLFQLKELIRTRIERCTVYILELENGKYYVGSTTNRKRRLQEHIKRKGSKWTKEHKPIRVLREYRRIPSRYVLGMESRVTAECMLEFGVNNVRGSMFCGTREFHMGDADALTKFIGHYNDLNYRKVSARLQSTLPPAPRRVRIVYNDGRCYRCGKKGHIAANCRTVKPFSKNDGIDVFAREP